ncbi:MAG: hypothetical protein MZV63_16635 [Marinilabiliales bacterium]|nr:hypothetical protein [Marinilabiliales bacterium]
MANAGALSTNLVNNPAIQNSGNNKKGKRYDVTISVFDITVFSTAPREQNKYAEAAGEAAGQNVHSEEGAYRAGLYVCFENVYSNAGAEHAGEIIAVDLDECGSLT